ncbi:nuclear pore complex protein Nup107 [Kwoniella heveanensis BCC8398]|uniref:Nuclear pore complex protein n=1 Tax=Kwoniella heveanensis BCC8398 TaxID=1296120 RepID=A0A1B9H4J3_9TREE|nr:nuclear pore complex protein Nup107 [Kwoniella heveanensis BCC8398]
MVALATPYQNFAKVLSSYHHQYAEAGPSSSSQLDSPIRYDAVLDEEGGLISALMGALEETVRHKTPTTSSTFEMDGEEQISAEEHQALLSEHRTWQLIRAVYENRLHRSDPSFMAGSSREQIDQNPYASPEDVTQTMVNEDSELSLWATLVDHLQTRPLLSAAPPIEARHGYLPSTLRRAKTVRPNPSVGGAPPTPPSLDPDFTVRDPHGQGLAGEDQTYQTPLLETLWDLVRHGELDQAIKVCEQGGEPWRGASLMGGRRWTMGGMTQDSIGVSPLEGNRRRALWKKSCRAIAKNPTLSSAERHLYAALISDLPTLLPACDTWEDYLWAHVQHRIENRLEQKWHELGGFWEEESAFLGRDDEDVEIAQGGLEDVFRSMSGTQKAGVANSMSDPYYVAQRMIILGRTDALFNQFADQLLKLEASVSPELIGPLVRFFAHLVLTLRTLGQSVPDSAANSIIQAYLTILEREGNDPLVAMYAACLREGSGEESYAKFLRAMDPNATREQRMEALSRAKQHNLDVAIIAKETVRMILSETFEDIPALSTSEPDITAISVGLTDRDVHLIRSIEWLTMTPETLDEALIKANDVARYFLALGQANAAQSLLRTLPNKLLDLLSTSSDFAEPNDPDHHILEYQSYTRLFAVFESHNAVADQQLKKPKNTATKLEVHNYRKALLSSVERCWDSTIEVVEGDWLRFRVNRKGDNGARRRSELSIIRRIFIPDLILRLHTLLIGTYRDNTNQPSGGSTGGNNSSDALTPFEGLLDKCFELIKIVAEEENHIYEEFLPRGDASAGGSGAGSGRLEVYLEKIRQVGLEALRVGRAGVYGAGVEGAM